jgi:uncharacterized protein (TIGR00159 family)
MRELLRLFRWQDALDIIILTFVFYRLYLRLRRKRALRMIFTILALPFFYALAQWIDLPLSVWSLQNLWAVILLVLVVLFQQEIREVLGSINLPNFLFGKPEAFTSKVVDKIAETAYDMANRRIGGLIVLQRTDDLDEFIHGETFLDSEVNEDMLMSIFNPQSPLHDGAVIVRGNRIRYAAALLPVSKSATLRKEWGTRHRAGLGITEISDAECIIVSEERKQVLLASRGRIDVKEGKDELKKSLLESAPAKERRRGAAWPQGVFSDLPRKAFFLLLVSVLWVFVIGARQGEITFNIPVEYYSVPRNLEILGEPPREINVRLKGSRRLLSSVRPENVRLQVDLSRCRSGMNQVSISEININVPSGIAVSHLYPRNIRIQLTQTQPPVKMR